MRKALLVVLVVAGLSSAAYAQTLAQVGGVSITLEQVVAANPAAKGDMIIRNQVLITLINRQAILNEAAKLGIEKTPEYAQALKDDEVNLVIRMMVERFTKANPVTDKDLEAGYKKAFDKRFPEEYRLREILVDSFKAAEAAIQELKAGKSFSILAAEKSQDTPTAAIGGELGWQVATALPAGILKAVKTMKVEQVAGPISIPQGFVVIQLLGERPTPKPTLDQVKPQLVTAIQQQAWIEHVIKLRTEQGAHLIVALPSQ
jgi:peptidyl-prolyl cis-trans isomerase C